MLKTTLRILSVVATVATTASAAWAGTMNASSAGQFVAPTQWQRGVIAGSAYALWDNSFTSLAGNAVPYTGSNLSAANVMAAYPASLTGWNVSDANPGSVTSTQHLYGAGQAALALSVTIPGYGLGAGYTTDFRLQSSTATLAPDPASFTVSADGGPAVPVAPTVTSLGGSGLNNLYEFELPGNALNYVLRFGTPSSGTNFKNTALNAVSIDTFASVPEPASLAAAGTGTLSLLALRRRRRRGATTTA